MMPRMPPLLVDTIIEAEAWEGMDLSALAEDAARAALTAVGLDPAAHEVSLLACDDARIAGLNAEFRGKPAPTNVLSWPSADLAPETPGDRPHLEEAEEELGDIALAWETCCREAKALDRPLEDHLRHLVIHGVLHLLGYDHETDEDAALMEGLEVRILAGMGIADPYAEGQDPPFDDGK